MISYEAIIYYNASIKRMTIFAKNLVEARELALNEGYRLTGHGLTGYLENVVVSPLKKVS